MDQSNEHLLPVFQIPICIVFPWSFAPLLFCKLAPERTKLNNIKCFLKPFKFYRTSEMVVPYYFQGQIFMHGKEYNITEQWIVVGTTEFQICIQFFAICRALIHSLFHKDKGQWFHLTRVKSLIMLIASLGSFSIKHWPKLYHCLHVLSQESKFLYALIS